MRKFRVYDTVKKKMYYSGFVLASDGSLCKVITTNKKGGLFVAKVKSYDTLTQMHQVTLQTVKFMPNEKQRYIIQFAIDRKDNYEQELYEGDILIYETGCAYVIVYGKYEGIFCPGDQRYTSSQGYVACEYEGGEINLNVTYPLSEVETLSRRYGNVCEGYVSIEER
ncbi:YopX family protein [Breznakia pachnodae]|uniref:YopX protein domain-containing protein n=1 Tax=Breznakia pachnodae TaxID=265178 RepID=A0ABU0E6N2_9FIRM|nr:YopX family protein [Breznakia pachnodae]MDQ0362564.1 hypothetical protein [Breznakia pachnodae]